MDIWRWLQDLITRLQSSLAPAEPVIPVTRKVLAITFAPLIPSLDNLPLYEAITGWNKPDELLRQLAIEMNTASSGYVTYDITENVVVPEFAPMEPGIRYTPELYLSACADHEPKIEDKADYPAILTQFNVLSKINSGAIDEVWMMGYPFAGFRESRMGGPDPFFCNGEILTGTESAGRRFVIMGFSYERGLGEMLESMAHRAESILDRVYGGKIGGANLYERFTRIDWDHPGQAEVGTVHHGPNATLTPDKDDHQWTETRLVPSRHRTWYQFPDLSGSPEPTSCDDWQAPDMTYGHHMWWFKHFPHIAGQTYGVSNNWWKYVIDPNTV
jgi:hypothetical protein